MSREIKDKTAMISNTIIPNLLSNYTAEELRILFTCISKIQMKYETLKKAEIEGTEGYFEGIQYLDGEGDYFYEKDKYTVYIPIKEFKDYALRGKYSKQEIKEIINALSVFIDYRENGVYKRLFIMTHIYYYESENAFEVMFDPENFDLIVDLLDNFTMVELLEAKKFKSKYQIGVYMKYKQFRSTGLAILGVEEAKNYFSSSLETFLLVDKIKKAVNTVNKVLGTDIRVHQEKNYKSETTNIMLVFSKAI